jgi:hypothetical protein
VRLLAELPKRIKEAELRVLDLEEALATVEVALELRKAEIQQEIAEAVTEDGKKLYPNDRARQAALELRLKSDPAYSERLKRWKQLKSELEQSKAELHYQVNRFKAAQAIAGILVLAGGDRRAADHGAQGREEAALRASRV